MYGGVERQSLCTWRVHRENHKGTVESCNLGHLYSTGTTYGRKNWPKFLFEQDLVSREVHQYRRDHFDHLCAPKDPDLE